MRYCVRQLMIKICTQRNSVWRFAGKKNLLFPLFIFLSLVATAQNPDIIYWSGSAPNGSWDWGTGCNAADGGNWYWTTSGTGTRQRFDCFATYNIVNFDNTNQPTMDLNSLSDFSVCQFKFITGSGSRTMSTSSGRSIYFQNTNGNNAKIENYVGGTTQTFTAIPMIVNSGGNIFELNPVNGNITITGSITNNSSNSIDVYGTGTLTVSGGISGTGVGLNLKSVSSAPTVVISGTNTYTGATVIDAGTLQLGAANTISNSSNFTLNGGTFSTGTGYSETVGTLSMTASSTISLGSASHSLNFTGAAATWTGTLTVSGYSPGSRRLYIGSSQILTSTQLAQISFSGYTSGARQLTTGEVVPAGPVVVTGSTGQDGTYTSLTNAGGAFAAINGAAQTGNTVLITIYSDVTTEAGTNTLNAGTWSTLTINPSGARTISGSVAGTALVSLNGADNVTINGLNSGGNSLIFSNTSTSNSANTSTIILTNDATSNTIQNCTISGSATGVGTGNILFGAGSSTGNDNNIITSCTLNPAGGNTPVNGIYSAGSVGFDNSSVTISNCNIQDYFNATIASAGIYVFSNNSTWTITGNKFYQTGTRTVTAVTSITCYGINISATSGSGFAISNNTIGYANSSGTGTSTYTGSVAYSVWGIYANTSTATTNSIQGNTIAGFSVTTTGNAAINNGNFIGINVIGGNYDIGTTTGNTIGSATGTGSIIVTLSANAALGGIVTNSSSTVNIQNNTIGSFTIGGGTSVSETFYGIVTSNISGTSATISSNIVGSTSTANSIVLGNSGTSIACNFYGVNNFTSTPTISSNTVQNCTLSGTGAHALWAIYTASVTGGTASITNNNVISNSFAGTSGTYYGIINTAAVATLTITGNIIRNAAISNSGVTFNGIYNTAAVTTTITISSNQLGNASGGLITYSAATATALTAIYNFGGASTAALTIQSNDIRGITHSATASNTIYCILNSAATLSQNISSNTFTNLSVNTTGSVYFIYNSVSLSGSGSKTISSNSISGTFTNASGSFTQFYFDAAASTAGATSTNSNNNFSNITLGSGATLQGWYNTETNSTKTIQNNTFNNIIITSGAISYAMRIEGTGSSGTVSGNTISSINNSSNQLYGIYNATGGTYTYSSNAINGLTGTTVYGIVLVAGTNTISQNIINTLSGSGSGTLALGIYLQSSTTVNIFKNKIYDISHSGTTVTSSALSSGIYVVGGTTVNIYNNLIGDIKAPNASGAFSAARGININSSTASSNINVYYNTIYLSATSVGAIFSTSGIYHATNPTATTAALDLRNNVIVNASTPSGTGFTIAYERSNTTLTNYASTSNSNLFYAGTPSSSRLIFYDGTNSDQSLTAFQIRVSSREQYSVTENPTFLNTTGSNPNYLHINTSVATLIESRGRNISSYTDDYDGDARNAARPDIGADEFTGITICNVNVTATGGLASGCYTTLKEAFDEINGGTHTGTIGISIVGNTTEVASASLNASGSGSASYSVITTNPSGARTVSGSIAGPLVDFNGADNVTIDGLNSGGNTLTIDNTLSATTPSAIRFIADATSNTITNCTIKSAETSTTLGTVFFSTGTSTGNDGNTISNNVITSSGSNFATNAIYSLGTSSAVDNSSISITGNSISDYFNATSVSMGINAAATGNSGWTISNNKLFQSATRLFTSANTHNAIFIGVGSGYTISNNIIGYANSSGTGITNMVGNSVSLTGTFPSSYSTTGTANATRYIALNCAFTAGGTVSNIQGNTIAGIALFTSSNATTANGILCGINVTSGNANIGTTTANTIGATSGQGSLYAATTQTGGTVVGIYATSVNTVSIQNNTFGSIDAVGSSATISGAFTAIDCAGASGIFTIDNNTIGNTTADNIRIGYTLSGGNLSNAGTLTSTTGTSSVLVGIRNAATGSTLSISSNTLRGWVTSGTATTVTGITNTGAITSTETINSNLLGTSSLDWIRYSVANSGNLFGILNSAGGSSAALTIQNNDVRGITHSVAGSSTHTYISNTAATLSQNVSSNTFTALSVNTTGTVNFISNSVTLTGSGTKTINSNSVVASFSKTGAGNSVYFYYDAGSTSSVSATITNNSNNFSNITVTGATIIQGWYNVDGAIGVSKNIQNNTFSTLNGGTNAIFPIQITNGTGNISGNIITGASAQNTVTGIGVTSGTFNIYSNTINTLSTVTPGSFAGVTGIYISGGTTISVYQNTINSLTTTATSSLASGITVSSGTTVNVYKNKIYGLANNSSSFASVGVTGITLSGGTTVTVYNNYVGDLTVSSVGINDAIRGIGISAGSGTMNIYYNTVYITGTSSGSGFGTSAVYANTGPTVNLRNNVFVNLSTPTGTGRAIAYWRNGATLTSYASTSNNNLFYAGTPGSVNLIYYDNTTSARTLAEFQGMLSNGGGTRDIYSVTENPTFLSTTGSSANFLHINTTVATYIESRGVNIAGITDDYDGDIRQGNAGYAGTGTAPDIGADEFEGIPITCGTVIVTSTGGTGAPSSCYFTLAAAVSAINGGTIHTGTITCSVPAGFIETAPAGGYQLTASGTSATPITYIKSGAGANPAITASASLTSGALTDGIFKLIGADYTTIDGFTMQENASNTTTTSGSNNMTEWGVALLRTSTTDGAQNNTIQNCTISLNKNYNNTFGIYSNTIHTATAVSYVDITSVGGANNSNKVYTNSISNINMGISFVGSRIAAFIDDGNDIGGANSSKGNTITNWGSASITASFTTVSVSGTFFGIYMNHQKTYNVSYNTLTSSTISPGSTSINGIRSDYTTATPTGTFTNTISSNTISLNATATTGLFIGINSINPTTSPTAGITLNITNNLIQNCSIAGVSTASLNGIANTLVCSYLNITGNSYLNNTSTSTSGAVNAISNSGAIITSINIDNNSIGNSSFGAITFSAANSGAHVFITNTAGASTCALSISSNNFQGIVHSTAGSGGHTYISNTAATSSQNISSNTFTNLFANNTGSITFISNSVPLTATGSKTISSNSIVTAYNKTSSGGFVTFYNDNGSSVSGATNTNNSNNFSNITLTGTTGILGWINSETSSAKTIQNNTFSTIICGSSSCEILTVSSSGSATVSGNTISSVSGGNLIRGIRSAGGTQNFTSNIISSLSSTGGNVDGIYLSAGTTNNISQNTISALSSSFAAGAITGISIAGGTTHNVYKNKIYDLSETNASVGLVTGIQVTAGTTISIYNNITGDLKASTANGTDVIRGININSTTANSNINLYYNTIYLSATSSGANFGTSGLYHTTGVSSTAALDMRNNIIVNNSTPNGTGTTAAYRRSSTALTNYATTSNNNLLYAGTSSATRLIFTDGTNSDQTMSAFITRVSTREANSVSENPPFLSTSGASVNFLHIDNSVSTVVESGGAVVAINPTGDYDGDARFGDGGYSGTGTAPDIGADEINAPVTSNYYFRSKSSGIWANPTYWESSPDGSTWANATSYPTSAATKINVLNTHTITISSTAAANALQVDAGGTLSHTSGIGFTIANGTGNDGSGTDYIVNGTYVINGTQPTFNASAVAEIRNGGLVRADANTGAASDDFAYSTSVTFKTGSVFQWNNTGAFQTAGITYLPNSTASDIPIFRVSANTLTVGSNTATVINGKFEVSSTYSQTWANNATKTFRDGIGGGGTITHDNTCGTFIISGTSAVIDGTTTIINIDNYAGTATDLQIASGGSCTISGSPTINIGTAVNSGSLFVVDGTLTHNGTTAVNFNTGSGDLTVNGSVGSGTGTFSLNSTATDIIVGGTSGGSAGTFKFTTGALTANTFTMTRSGSGADATLGSDFIVTNAFSNSDANATFSIASNTLTLNGNVSNTGYFNGTTASNLTIANAGTISSLRFSSPGNMNNFTLSRTSATPALGTDLITNGILNITSNTSHLNIASSTLTLAGAITGSGSLYGTTSSNLTMTGTGQVGTLRFATGGQLLNTLSINRTGITNNYAALLGSSLTVNALTLTNGIIATDNYLLTWTKIGSLLPAAQTSYTANTTGYKNSYICLCTSAGASLTFTTPYAGSVGFKVNNVGTDTWFPIGVDFKSPNRMWINNTGTSDNIAVAMKKGDIGGTDKPVVERIWYLKEDITGGTTASMRLYFTKQDPSLYPGSQDEVESGFIYTDQHLVQKDYNDPNYIDVAQFGDVQDGSTNTLGTELYGQYTIGVSPDILNSTNGINQFSRFTVLNISNIILPVTVVNLAAYQSGNHVNVLWTSLTEINMDHYEVERSTNGLQFTALGKITAKGNGLQRTDYSFTDMLPNNGNNFYRIKIFDKSGRISYTSVVSVHIGGGITGITVYPNPVVGKTATLAFSNMEAGSYAVTIYDNAGKRVYSKQIEHIGGSASYVMYLPAYMVQGIYHVNIQNKKYQVTKEILVE